MGGSEKNRRTVITSLQLSFRRHDRNFTPLPFIEKETPLAVKTCQTHLASISRVYKIDISFPNSDFMQFLGHSSK